MTYFFKTFTETKSKVKHANKNIFYEARKIFYCIKFYVKKYIPRRKHIGNLERIKRGVRQRRFRDPL